MAGRASIAHLAPAAAICTLIMLGFSAPAEGKNLTFSLISKDIEDINFINAWRGCSDAARHNGDECLHMGDTRVGYFRGQLDAINKAIALKVDGIAISVTNSAFIAKDGLPDALDRKIPVITFDSDLEPPDQPLRRAYIGPNNFGIGIRLARILKEKAPKGASICIMSGGRFDPNLNERIAGIRHELRRTPEYPALKPAPESAKTPLNGENGWTEDDRCPLYNKGDDNIGLSQFAQAVQNSTTDFIVPVGAWLLGDPVRMAKIMAIHGPRAPQLIMATGSPGEEQDRLTRKGIIDGYVAIDFYRMGELAYQQMRNYATGENVVITDEIPLHIRLGGDIQMGENPM